ncbi:MAG: DJ-1/PfpI family protein [Deltaproteobacteria bacterium]|nr:DJ-1/PfpI family protein [Deltaproteobacteria bacterium]
MKRAIAFLQPGWADWELGPVLAGLRFYLQYETLIASPDGRPVTSMGGVRANADLAFATASLNDRPLLLLIGSEAWSGFRDEGLLALLRQSRDQGWVIGAICAGTVAAARAGLLEGRAHTSNGRRWLLEQAPGYAGAEGYRDEKHAVADGQLVAAPGSAPNTFAAELFRLAAPDRPEVAAGFRAMAAGEWE